MTRTIRTLRTTAGSMLAEIGAAVGTFAALTWVTGNAVAAGIGLLGVSPTDGWLPEVGVWGAVFCVAAVVTIWLERGGYRRLRADATGGGDFAWLSLCYLPVTFLPAGYALAVLVDPPGIALNLYLVACVAAAAWLAFYGGLERLALETTQFGWAFLAVFVTAIAGAVVVSVLPVSAALEWVAGSWPTDERVLAAAAIVGQGLVLRFGFGFGGGPGGGARGT